mgnify:CR=1 FL=1
MIPTDIKVKIGPNSWPVSLPDFITREDILFKWHEAQDDVLVTRRVSAAAVGLCTRVGKLAKADYARSRCDVLVYGGQVYTYLREQGVPLEEVLRAGFEIVSCMVNHVAPRASEVEERVGFTDPLAADSTGT